MSGMKSQFTRQKTIPITIIFTLALSFAYFSQPLVKAVTYGTEIENAGTLFPYVVQIWTSVDKGATDDFLCSGTLIKPDIVLTAAHCARALNSSSIDRIYVGVGSDSFDQAKQWNTVNSVWWSPRYSKDRHVNDIGLILLAIEVDRGIAKPLPLSSATVYNSSKSLSTYKIYGWGRDQNGDLPGVLQSAVVTDQTKSALKIYNSGFNPQTMIAAGGFNSVEKTFSGGCSGDSGGPLIGKYKGNTILFGVTGYVSSEGCDVKAPTVFARVSYYLSDLSAGEIRLRRMTTFVNKENILQKTLDYMNRGQSGLKWIDSSDSYLPENANSSIQSEDETCQLIVYSSEQSLKKDFPETGNPEEVDSDYGSVKELGNWWFLLRADSRESSCFTEAQTYLNLG